MSDIIQDAQQLLEGATPAPWELSETEVTHRLLGGEAYEFGGEPLLVIGGDPEKDTSIEHEDAEDEPPYFYLIQHCADGELMAAAPELAQAVAEEAWEYSFQTLYADGWETACDDVTHVDKWWPDKSDAEDSANSSYDPYIERTIRLVRRRVSPPEVIND